MKIKFNKLLWLLILVGVSYQTNAQNWGSFGNVLSQLDSARRIQFLNNLNTLQSSWNTDSLKLGSGLDSLNAAIGGIDPTMNLDSLTAEWGIRRDSLLSYLPTTSLDVNDQDTLVSEFDRIRGIWFTNNDSITRAFGLYQDSLTGQVPVFGTSLDTLGTEHQTSLDSLNHNLALALNASPANGIGNFSGLFHQIFNKNLITSMEFYGGRMTTNGSYYESNFNTPANVIGIRSVEQFDRTWEPRWAFQVSGTTKALGAPKNGEKDGAGGNDRFNPLTIDGNFSIMYNLDILTIGENAPVRLISLLGIEASTFCPTYRDFNQPFTTNNKGFTTGWGPQIGAGFSTKIARFMAYTLGTLSYGDVNLGGSGYHYFNTQVEAGIRFDNKVTMRVRTGTSTWAPQSHKILQSHQVTVGVPIAALFKL
jgi:hypothetical protein